MKGANVLGVLFVAFCFSMSSKNVPLFVRRDFQAYKNIPSADIMSVVSCKLVRFDRLPLLKPIDQPSDYLKDVGLNETNNSKGR